MWKILVVDAQCLPRMGLASVLEAQPDLAVCDQAATAAEALSMAEAHDPDLVILELLVPDMRGMELIRRLRARKPTQCVLVFSCRDEMLCAERALMAGARGYVMKSEPPAVLLRAVRHVLGGGIYVSDPVNNRLLLELTHHQPCSLFPSEVLSHRELEVFDLTGQGLSSQEIADHMQLARKTVESYRLRIKNKLHLSSSTELVQRAVRWVEDEKC